MTLRRWVLVLRGRKSGLMTPVSFCSYYLKISALEQRERLNARSPTVSHGDKLVEYVVYDKWRKRIVEE